MRLGRDDEAYQQLKTCYNNHFQDTATKNSLTLMDSYKKFVTFQTDHTILKVDKNEADLLHPYFEEEMERGIATYEKKYNFKLEHPVQVEVYPDHEDFAVRTLGMPGLGALGVTFGYAIAMDSPSGRPPGQFHWASTLWHEMSHVFTLTMTKFARAALVHRRHGGARRDRRLARMGRPPGSGRNFGHQEPATAARLPSWTAASCIRRARTQVMVSYFQAGRICDYINDKWGWDTLLAMLQDSRPSEDTPT